MPYGLIGLYIMLSVWKYKDNLSVDCYGIFLKHADFGGTDITYFFHRLGKDGLPIVFDNGGKKMDLVSDTRLKQAEHITQIKQNEAFEGDIV